MTDPTAAHPVPVTDPLSIVALETERHVAGFGWDQPPRLFALVPTDRLIAEEPGLAQQLGATAAPGALTAVEQDDLPTTSDVVQLLAQIGWPPEVAGAAVAVERIVVPPEAEHGLPEDPEQAIRVLAAHPDRADVRLLVAVLRDGPAVCLLRQRAHDRDDRVASGPDIAPGLVHALRATLAD